MPEVEFPKLHPHPFRNLTTDATPASRRESGYAELCVTSNFTFLCGASHPEELVQRAAELGYAAIAITDLHTLAGIVRAHVAAKAFQIRLVIGARLRLSDLPGVELMMYPTDRASYGRLCRLLTIGKRRAAKGACLLNSDDLPRLAQGCVAIAIAQPESSEAEASLAKLKQVFADDRLSLGAPLHYRGDDAVRVQHWADVSHRVGIPLLATNDVLYHDPERRMLQDVLTCIRHRCTLAQAGFRLEANAERHLKSPEVMTELYREHPEALRRTLWIAEQCAGFNLDELRYQYPDEVVPAGKNAMQHLIELTWSGAANRFPAGVPDKVQRQLQHELQLIEELHYAHYFLTVHDLVEFARGRDILCQGRGAAANSAVCYCLGITAVSPGLIEMLFERFISRERDEPPDIDIDFEHSRREEVIQYIYSKYGRERAALVAVVITYRKRSAIRDVGKALGLSLDLVDVLAKDQQWWDAGALDTSRMRAMGLNPADTTIQWLVRLVKTLLGFPRHLSQHVGGFVMSQPPLCELVPIENAAMIDRTVIEWDKDDVDAMGLLKVDVLALGMLTALRRCLNMINSRHQTNLSLASIPERDEATYEMIRKADTVGVFQIESRAQMSMLPRLKPATFYDLVIEVAIVRPGPIQGDMVHPYLRRRDGLETVDYVHPSIEQVLRKTLGVPLFQEQCMSLAVKAAGFTPGEADQLRRAMAAWKRSGDKMAGFRSKFVDGMTRNGIPLDFAERCFRQIQGFSEYGFPESHAASFALLAYASSWLKRHHPTEFTASLLNSQPMGFYAPAQLVRDAREHQVQVRTVDVHDSDWDCTVEADGALRLGMRMISGLSESDGRKIRAAVERRGRFSSLLALWRASGARAAALRRLAAADAFGTMGLTRQKAMWEARQLKDHALPLFDEADAARPFDGHVDLPAFSDAHEVGRDYVTVGLSLRNHPLAFIRDALNKMRVSPCGDLREIDRTPDGEWIAVAGLVLVRQRPGTAEGVTFMTIEDETGIANIIVWRRVYQRYRSAASSHLVIVQGRVQRQSGVVHVIASRIRKFTGREAATSMATEATHARNFR